MTLRCSIILQRPPRGHSSIQGWSSPGNMGIPGYFRHSNHPRAAPRLHGRADGAAGVLRIRVHARQQRALAGNQAHGARPQRRRRVLHHLAGRHKALVRLHRRRREPRKRALLGAQHLRSACQKASLGLRGLHHVDAVSMTSSSAQTIHAGQDIRHNEPAFSCTNCGQQQEGHSGSRSAPGCCRRASWTAAAARRRRP